MPPPNRIISAGTKYNFLGFYNEDTILIGGTTTPPAAGESSGFVQLLGLKTAAPATGTPETVSITGDDQLLGEFDFDSVEARTFIADYAAQNLTVDANLLGVTIRTVAGASFVVGDINNAPQRTVAIIYNSRTKSQDPGTSGAGKWSSKIILSASARPLGRTAFTEREGAVYQLSVSPQLAAYDLPGVTIVTSVHGTEGARYDNVTSDYPLHAQIIRGDGAQTTFALDYAPISASRAQATVNRVVVNIASVNPTAKTVTLSAAPANNSYGVILYQFNG